MAIAKDLVGPPRGMRDLLPDEVELRDRVMAAILGVYTAWGYRHIETPALESIRNITAGQGGENEKLIFKVLRRGEEIRDWAQAAALDDLVEYGLRFDLTVPLVRYYAHNRAKLPRLFKAIQIGPVWRAERPQRGRFRQFVQCDIDVIGSAAPLVEVELCAATAAALQAVGFRDFTIRLNDRRVLEEVSASSGFTPGQFAQVSVTVDKLDKIGFPGVINELAGLNFPQINVNNFIGSLRQIRDSVASNTPIIRVLESRVDHSVAEKLDTIIRSLNSIADRAWNAVFDPTLVRGMGYYTGPVFEIAYKDLPFSLAGGGRYDRMIGRLLGEEVPACGFSIGFERIVAVLLEERAQAARAGRVAVIVDDGVAPERGLTEAARLRAEGAPATVLPRDKNLGRQLKALAADGYDRFAILREAGLSAIESTVLENPQ